jgi:hypothetical protein
MREFFINGDRYEVSKAQNGYNININHEDKYLTDTYANALEFILLLLECESDEDKEMVEKTFFHEQYELEGLTEDEEIEDYDDCDYEIGFNPYMGCYDYDC